MEGEKKEDVKCQDATGPPPWNPGTRGSLHVSNLSYMLHSTYSWLTQSSKCLPTIFLPVSNQDELAEERCRQVFGHFTHLQREEEPAYYHLAPGRDLYCSVRNTTTSAHNRNLDWEVIVVDDASPDGTQEVAKQLAGIYGEDRVVGQS